MKKLFNKLKRKQTYYRIPELERMRLIEKASIQVSRGVFFSTIIIITFFAGVFTNRPGRETLPPAGIHKNIHHDCGCVAGANLSPVLISFL